jgi:hypothetical protein
MTREDWEIFRRQFGAGSRRNETSQRLSYEADYCDYLIVRNNLGRYRTVYSR